MTTWFVQIPIGNNTIYIYVFTSNSVVVGRSLVFHITLSIFQSIVHEIMYENVSLNLISDLYAEAMKARESMPLTETIKTCCQGAASSSANTSDADSTHSSNSGSLTHYQNVYDSFDVSFPKRPEVNIEFEKIKYTVRKFNITEKKFGK